MRRSTILNIDAPLGTTGSLCKRNSSGKVVGLALAWRLTRFGLAGSPGQGGHATWLRNGCSSSEHAEASRSLLTFCLHVDDRFHGEPKKQLCETMSTPSKLDQQKATGDRKCRQCPYCKRCGSMNGSFLRLLEICQSKPTHKFKSCRAIAGMHPQSGSV